MRMHTLLAVAGGLSLVVGCQYNANVKASTNTGVQGDSDFSTNAASQPQMTEPAPPPAAPAEPPPPSAPICPIACYAPSGANHNLVTAEEHAQIKAALEPAFARMHQCMEGAHAEAAQYDQQGYRVRGRGRGHRSPVLNLRIAPDGKLEDLGVDPHHGYDERCMDVAAREAATNLSLPGRHTVRCHEQCVVAADPRVVTPAAPRTRGRGTRRR